jgi:hypothetical protein
MDYKELLEKYNLLLSESKRLIEENEGEIGIFSRLLESMAGRIVRQTQNALFKMFQSVICSIR